MSTRASLLACCVLPLVVAGFGGKGDGTVAVAITVVTTPGSVRVDPCAAGQISTPQRPCGGPTRWVQVGTTTTESFHFTCNPASGDLPLLESICRDIQLYPGQMLRPKAPKDYPVMGRCGGIDGVSPGSAMMTVKTVAGGKSFTFSDRLGGCRKHPPYAAAILYATAIRKDRATLALIEPGLRCLSDPSFLCVDELRHSLGEVVDIAQRAPELDRLDPLTLFQIVDAGSFFDTTGTRSCPIAVPGPNPGTIASFLAGRCTIEVRGLTKRTSWPIVVFTEEWPIATGGTAKHTWTVVLSSYRHAAWIRSVTETGPLPPQFRH
jgi:hypothetical protein